MSIGMPSRAIGRLSLYRRLLVHGLPSEQSHIHSHELAAMAQVSAPQVRRDLMLAPCEGSPRGYHVQELVSSIGELLDPPEGANLALVGVGNLGRALLAYFGARSPRIRLVAAFDNDPLIAGRSFAGVFCHAVSDLPRVVHQQQVVAAILTVPADAAQDTADLLVDAGVRGILNFAPAPLHVPPHVFLEEIDMTMALEKLVYFACGSARARKGPA